MGPGRVVAGEDGEVRQLEVLIASGDQVLAEGLLVGGHGGRHAEARVGVDIGRADEALHQLVGGVIVLGEQLARYVERHRVRPVAGDDIAEPTRDLAHRLIPANHAAADHGVQEPTFQANG